MHYSEGHDTIVSLQRICKCTQLKTPINLTLLKATYSGSHVDEVQISS